MQFTVRQIMIATAVIGFLLWLGLYLPTPLIVIVSTWMAFGVFYASAMRMMRLSLRQRLIVEVATLIILVSLSAVIWRPDFYTSEGQRCEELAYLAREATAPSPEARVALDREAEWFSRRASALRWRGLWLGLTMGPSTRDVSKLSRADEVHQLGVLESVEKHEKAARRYTSTTPQSP